MLNKVNWEKQWAQHCPVFKKGKAHIPLPTKERFELIPGPGFGDLSHPTTQLMIELMPSYVSNKVIFDIGCGSGILSIAAAKMGATQVFCCDIDPQAQLHTEKNALLNGIKLFSGPPPLSKKPIILMNMIASEQINAWEEHRRLFDVIITSGILAADQKCYLEFANKAGWQLVEKRKHDEWMGYIFKDIQ